MGQEEPETIQEIAKTIKDEAIIIQRKINDLEERINLSTNSAIKTELEAKLSVLIEERSTIVSEILFVFIFSPYVLILFSL